MAYFNNGFPVNYQPAYQAPQFQAQQPAQQGGIIWVQGEAAAKSYLVAPNTTVQLWDVESGVIYIKSADGSGMPSMKILDYKVRGDAPATPAAPAVEYATKDEVNALADKVRDLRDDLNGRRRANRLMKEEEEHE